MEVQNTTFFVLIVSGSTYDVNNNSYQTIAMPSVGTVQPWEIAFNKNSYDTYSALAWSNVAATLINANNAAYGLDNNVYAVTL